jgi:hypothetical protein
MNTENDMKIIRSKLINLQNDLDDIVSITNGALTISEEEHNPALVTIHNNDKGLQEAVTKKSPIIYSPYVTGGRKNKTKSNKRNTKRNRKTSKRNRNRK